MTHKHPHLTHQKYRPDIDGLRAVAILSVVAYHAIPWRMPGGFIGVDIFFVISGFLISTIIFSSLERGRFSLVEFYVRRVRRIFPALILVLISCFAVGWFVLFDDEYQQLGKHTAASAAFIQNFILWRESGYFDNDAGTKPLLHLWSLAIEEQFYIFWPLLLAFVWKRKWSFLSITVVIAVVSFAVNIYLIQRSQTSSFYLPVSRFWELMMGGMLAYTALHRPHLIDKHKNGQSIIGFSLLLCGLIVLNNGRDFPGWWALLPTVGALFIISAGPNAWLNQKLLANKVMVWIGLISYPLYLWHWPLLSFLMIENGDLSRVESVGAVVVAVVLSWLTYRFVEGSFRLGGHARIKAAGLLVAMLLLFIFGMLLLDSKKFSELKRSDEGRNVYLAYFENSMPEWRYFSRIDHVQKFRGDCDYYDLDKYRVGQATAIPRSGINESCYTRDLRFDHALFIWGDSHAQMLYYGIKNNLPADWQILMGASSGCVANPNIVKPSSIQYCDQSNWFALQTITKTKPDVVIVAQGHGHSIGNMNKIMAKLQDIGVKRIIFTGPSPQWKPDLPKVVARKLWNNTPRRTYIGIDQGVINLNNRLKLEFRHQNGVDFVSLIDFFCSAEGCLTYIGGDRQLGITTWDYGHLTPIASDLLAKNLLVKEIIAPIDDQGFTRPTPQY